jgi:hypothetical protein
MLYNKSHPDFALLDNLCKTVMKMTHSIIANGSDNHLGKDYQKLPRLENMESYKIFSHKNEYRIKLNAEIATLHVRKIKTEEAGSYTDYLTADLLNKIIKHLIYGFGNCEIQSHVSLFLFLSAGLFHSLQCEISMWKIKKPDHVLLMLKSREHSILFDPWNDFYKIIPQNRVFFSQVLKEIINETYQNSAPKNCSWDEVGAIVSFDVQENYFFRDDKNLTCLFEGVLEGRNKLKHAIQAYISSSKNEYTRPLYGLLNAESILK